MRISSITAFVGFVLLFAGTYCPLLRPFHLFNWNVYQLNQPYGLILLLIAVIGVAASVLNQAKLLRFTAWLALGLVILLFIAALLKIHFTFSFIPFHGIDAFLARQIKLKWGWYVLVAGPAIALAGALSNKQRGYVKPVEESTQNPIP